MSKTKIIAISIMILIVAGVGMGFGFYVMQQFKKSSDDVHSFSTTHKTACQIFSLSDAKELFGNKVKNAPSNNQTPPTLEVPKSQKKIQPPKDTSIPPPVAEIVNEEAKSQEKSTSSKTAVPSTNKEKVIVTDCRYILDDAGGSIGIALRTFNSKGDAKDAFKKDRSPKQQKITGYGEEAFWHTSKSLSGGEEYGSLSILRAGNILVISGSKKDLTLFKRVADTAMSKF